MKLVAYLRVSTDRQAEEGFGLDVQEKAIRRWAKDNGHRIIKWARDEGVSGSNGVESRTGLPEALLALEDGTADGLLTYNLDRLARKLTVQEAILGHVWASGASVFTVEDHGEVPEDDPDDPMRSAIRQMRGVFAELERKMITKRLRDGRKAKAAKGGFAYGQAPYGFRAENRALVRDDAQQATLDRICALRASGASLREIAATLSTEGHRTKRGGRWQPETLRKILARQRA